MPDIVRSQEYVVSTLAGTTTSGFVNGTGPSARFAMPCGVAFNNGFIYVGDRDNNSVRKVNVTTRVVTTLAGNGTPGLVNGPISGTQFNFLHATAFDGAGNLYVADVNNECVRKITPAGIVSTLAGSGTSGYVNATGTAAQFSAFRSLDVDRSGTVFVADFYNHCIRKVTPSGVVTTISGNPGNVGFTNGAASVATFNLPHAVCVDTFGNVYVGEVGNNCIRKISPSGVVTTFAGNGTAGLVDGTGAQARFYAPTGLAADVNGNIYVADQGNNAIRKITPPGKVTTIAGKGSMGYLDTIGSQALFNRPAYVSIDNATGIIYVGDEFNHCIRKLTPVSLKANFSASDSIICAGALVKFKDLTTNNPTAWKWTFTGGTPDTSSIQNPTIIYNTAGSYKVTLKVSNPQGSDSLTKSGYIIVADRPFAGILPLTSDTICFGGSVQLSDTGSIGTIQWQSSEDGILFGNIVGDTLSEISITTASHTIYYRLSASNNCGIDSSAAFKLVVNPLPVPVIASADSVICSGDSTKVCTSNSFKTYQWNTGANSACTTVKVAGGYWVTVTDANHCSAVSGHQNISVYPVPSVSIVVQGDTFYSYNAVAYQWYKDGFPISNATSAVYVAHEQGAYSVAVTDSNGCEAVSNPISYTGINDVEEETMQLYPNPFTHSIIILGNNINGIEVYGLAGRIVFSENLKVPDQRMQADLSDLAEGMYYMKIKQKNRFVYKPVIKL